MRDPVTKLAIVDPAHVEKEIAKNFKEFFTIPGRLSLLHYVGRVTRKTRLGTEKRILLISNSCVYMCREDNTKKRCIRISAIQEALMTSDSFVVLKIPTEYDSCFKLQNVAETDYVLNVLRVTKSFTSSDGMPLQVSNRQQISGVNVNYSTPSNYVCEMVEVPTVHEVDNRQMAIDAFLAPPPPPVPKGNPKLAVKEVPTQEAQTILDHPLFDGSMSVPPPKGVMAMSAYGSHAAAAAAAGKPFEQANPNANNMDPQKVQHLQQLAQTLTEQQEAQLEIAKRMKIQEHNMQQQQHSGIGISKKEGSTGPGDGGLPGGEGRKDRSLLLQQDVNDFAPVEHNVAPQWQSPASLQANLSPLNNQRPPGGGRDRSPEHDQVMQARVIALEEEILNLKEQNELQMFEASRLRQEQSYRNTQPTGAYNVRSAPGNSHFGPPPRFTDPALAPVTTGRVLPQPAVGSSPPPHPPQVSANSQQMHAVASVGHSSPPRMSVADFEVSLVGKPLEERLVLRQYQIDDRRSKIASVMQSNYNSVEVFTLQEEMLELVKQMDADMLTAAHNEPAILEKRHPAGPSKTQNSSKQGTPPSVASPVPQTPQQDAMVNYQQSQFPAGQQQAGGAFVDWMTQVTSALAQHQTQQAQQPPQQQQQPPPGKEARGREPTSTSANQRASPGRPTRSRTPVKTSRNWRH